MVLLWNDLKSDLMREFANMIYELYMPSAVYAGYAQTKEGRDRMTMTWPDQLEEELLEENKKISWENGSETWCEKEEENKDNENTDRVDANQENSDRENSNQEDSNQEKTNQMNEGKEKQPENTNTEVVELKQLIPNECREDYSELISRFYTIDANTEANEELLDADRFAKMDLSISKDVEGPQILIYHTHSKEGFTDSEDVAENGIVGVGEALAQCLKEKYGYQVLHHLGQYDKDGREDAYSKALPEIQSLLEENPGIQVVIDLHRDQMPEDTKLVTEVDGLPTARFMFFNGLSRTKKTGPLSYLENEYQEENLAFSFQMKLLADTFYPGLTRKNYLKGYRYNMHLCPRSLLIELGAQNNTYQEAVNACEPLARLLDMVLRGNG